VTSNGLTRADTNDRGMLDVVGFDTSASPKTSALGSCDSSHRNFPDFSSQNLLARHQYVFYSL